MTFANPPAVLTDRRALLGAGGRPIDLARTPLARRQDLSLIDGTRTEAFLLRTNGRWQVEDYAVGATDLWWSDPRFCTRYSAVMPRAMCQ